MTAIHLLGPPVPLPSNPLRIFCSPFRLHPSHLDTSLPVTTVHTLTDNHPRLSSLLTVQAPMRWFWRATSTSVEELDPSVPRVRPRAAFLSIMLLPLQYLLSYPFGLQRTPRPPPSNCRPPALRVHQQLSACIPGF